MLLRFRVRAVAGAAALCLWSAATVVAAGAGWRPPETIAPRAETQLLSSPLVALDGQGTAISTWGVMTASGWSGAIAERRARTGWTDSRTLPRVPEALAMNERGDAVIAWIEPDSKGRRVAVSWRRPDGGWQPRTLVSPAGQDAAAPRVALDARGGALVVWAVRPGAAHESLVVAAARSLRGSWTRPRILAVGTEAEPAIAADGSALVVWSQTCAAVAPAAKCTPLGAVVRSAARSARGRWSRPRTLSPLAEDSRFPRLRVNARGTALVLWETYRPNEGAPPSRGIKVAIGSTTGAFGRPQALFGAAADGSGRVALAPTGDAVAVWASDDRVYAATRRPRGRFAEAVALGSGFEPEVGIDRRGAAIAVWTRPEGTPISLQGLFVRAARRPAGGAFDAGVDLAPVGRDCTRHRGCASEVVLATAASGDAVAVWRAHQGSGLGLGESSLHAAVYAR